MTNVNWNRFWSQVIKTPGCWLYQGTLTKKGYGTFSRCLAHRLSYLYHNKVLVSQLDVLHICDVRNCVKPSHLYQGTNQQNMQDRNLRGRQAKGSQNGSSKLTEQDVIFIKSLLAVGYYQRAIARLYRLNTPTAIWKIANGLGWIHV